VKTDKNVITFIREIYKTDGLINLHEPSFDKKDFSQLNKTLKSTFVSTSGKEIDQFELNLKKIVPAKDIISTVNGTSAIHLALILSGIKAKDLVLTPSFNFVAACNAISYLGAEPVFVDISKSNLGICPIAIEQFLFENAKLDSDGNCFEKRSKRKIKALIGMHSFGHPFDIDKIKQVCKKWRLNLIEDSAESLGSYYKGKHTGSFGNFGTLSFNGNKIITTGGGGAIICDSRKNGKLARHLSTTAKKRSEDFFHDRVGYNYRMPNLNASLGCSQLNKLQKKLTLKREVANLYENFFKNSDYIFIKEPSYAKSNYWLNAILMPNLKERNNFIKKTNEDGIITRPSWYLMHKLPMFKECMKGNLENSLDTWKRLVNLPSSPREI